MSDEIIRMRRVRKQVHIEPAFTATVTTYESVTIDWDKRRQMQNLYRNGDPDDDRWEDNYD